MRRQIANGMPIKERPGWIAMEQQQYRLAPFINVMECVPIYVDKPAREGKEAPVEPLRVQFSVIHLWAIWPKCSPDPLSRR